MVLTTAQALIRFLNAQYIEIDGVQSPFVRGVFTVFGHGNVLGIGQALEQEPGHLKVYQGRNEQGMAHAAIAFAKQRLRREIFACTSSVGPGAANMVTAAGTATANNIPVLLLPGDVYASRQPDPVLQQIEQTDDLSISTNDAFKAVSKYFDRISRPEQLMSAMLSAMRVLTDWGDTGAVTIALPQDVQGESYDYPESFFKKRVWRLERTAPTSAMLQEAVDAINNSKKPLVICGGGVRYSGAALAMQSFCEKYDIPFVETQAGKSALPWSHPLNMGGVGVTGGLAANLLAKEADLIIGIGTRYTDFTSSSKWIFQNPDVRFLNINPSRFHAGKLDAIQIVADAKAALNALTGALAGYNSAWGAAPFFAKEKWQAEMGRLFSTDASSEGFTPEVKGHLDDRLCDYESSTGATLTQTEVLGRLQELMAPNSVVVGSSGSLPGDMQRIWLPKEPETYHMEYGYSCMGYEICGAVGVKIACPDQEVYAMVGDGSFLMLHSELITSLQMGHKINVILFDNAGFGCINNLQMSHGMGSFATEFRYGNELSGGVMSIDYAKVAEGYGAASYQVKTIDELAAAFKDAARQKRSTLIDIKVLPKTMTEGYESWWNTGAASVSSSDEQKKTYEDVVRHRSEARKY
ncbi:MAG: 3D-(3,5/4)-trihydroxycyclohexane-1,2-dione acylhydrolase (decyclizing) [Christensenellales bacterium]|jgi:3D-(3,5/4)-trihydroxycyclohexane-1,2-dione acylhydrolase (decyclizing)